MTILRTTITKRTKKASCKNGAYLATFNVDDDRILLYSQGALVAVLGETDGELNVQDSQSESNYCSIKKIKKLEITMIVEEKVL